MSEAIKKIIIIGGGSAGWLTAAVIASTYRTDKNHGIHLSLIESDEIAPLGVGEGTWPIMRSTLKSIGLSEVDFLIDCDASFKQGSKFINWMNGKQDHYYHPFTLPVGHSQLDIAEYWQAYKDIKNFADSVCPQGIVGEQALAPKLLSAEEYGFTLNYGYHLDAGKFGQTLKRHCINKLGVSHIIDHVVKVNTQENHDIKSLSTKAHGDLEADLFVDCSGFKSVLLGEHYNIPYCNKQNILFNDSALAAQVPYANDNESIASFTLSTAQTAGWIWDIGLQSRRGIGHSYSSAHIDRETAEKELRDYIGEKTGCDQTDHIPVKKISFNPGHREKFWHRNCVAVGVSAGFIEPLEASALAMIELSARMIADQLPADRASMDLVAKRFNQKFIYRWQKIVDFLKLHYVLSQREDSDYWIENKSQSTMPDSLQEMMQLWQWQSPSKYDLPQTEELFPAASYQYVLYGMGHNSKPMSRTKRTEHKQLADKLFNDNSKQSKQLLSALPSNRDFLNSIKQNRAQSA